MPKFFSNSRTTDGPAIYLVSKPEDNPTFIDPKESGAYEKIRQRNIDEWERLFKDLKISQMKTGISHTSR